MAARIVLNDVQAWVDYSKLGLIDGLDQHLLLQLEEEVLARVAGVYDTSAWLTPETTPKLIKVIIAKKYASWLYDKRYSENQDEGNDYARRLEQNAEMLIVGLIDGTIEIPGVTPANPSIAAFYPNDFSSSQEPTLEDPSLGPAKFSMGRAF